MERCKVKVVEDGRIQYVDYKCRPFPMRVKDHCEDENANFCVAFTSARYCTELGIGFAALALVALLIGVSTHSRRRRIWRAVAGLVALNGMSKHRRDLSDLTCFVAIFQLVTFALITGVYHRGLYAPFDDARLSECLVVCPLYIPLMCLVGAGYYMNAVSWVVGMFLAGGVVTTGISADKGKRSYISLLFFLLMLTGRCPGHPWAAGNRAYRPIRG